MVIGQTVRDMTDLTKDKFPSILALTVVPKELYASLAKIPRNVQDDFSDDYLHAEELVLRKYKLQYPADESHLAQNYHDIEYLRDTIMCDGYIDEGEQFGIMTYDPSLGARTYVPKDGVELDDVVTIWPVEVWAALWAARDQVAFECMSRRNIQYFLKRGY